MTVKMPKVAVVGNMTFGTNSRSLRDGFERLGCDVRDLNIASAVSPVRFSPEWWILRKTHSPAPWVMKKIDRELHDLTRDWVPDILIAIKTIQIDQAMLLNSRARVRVHMSFDDVSNPENVTPSYMAHEPLWDAIVTTKLHNVDELRSRQARHAIHIQNAYDPAIHRFTHAFSTRPFDIGFIGAWRPDRAELPSQLGEIPELSTCVVGPRWNKSRRPNGSCAVLDEAIGIRYTIAGNGIKIGLLLLNSANRDTETARSYELPAMGQLPVGMDTHEHRALFQDDADYVLSPSFMEAVNRAVELAGRPRESEAIAQRIRIRVATNQNTYEARAATILNSLSA